MLSELPNILLFLKPDSAGNLSELSSEQLRDEVTDWANSKFSGTSLEQFQAARDRNNLVKKSGTLDSEFTEYFEQFLSDTGIQRKHNKQADQVFYRSKILGSSFHRKDELDQEVPVLLNQLMSMWVMYVDKFFTETESQALMSVVNENYQNQLAWTGSPLEMPVTTAFQSIWSQFVADSYLYESVGETLLSGIKSDVVPPPPVPVDISPDAEPPAPTDVDPEAPPV